ncbi:TetR family transcriptional regulator [Actinomadura sp. DC4]|uniref:acyl-CoA-like ligand-binding transcription factor n=1 Tax=Actinomadura sp. DC4 TaxID=3055069 RepID=UPI0025B06A16|nr:TetR family transcriptional regulator [Actinomadura sp. DC4]MDN3358352.1 TetR family transcriptional regulator [Actinomadura sp. DC4]
MTTPRAAGLRERKKQQTREALSWAALRLAVDRGFGNVLVEDIAAEAGVSPRTFNNYFSSKAEAIVWRQMNRYRQVAALLRACPADEPLWDAISSAVMGAFGEGEKLPDSGWTTGVRRILAESEFQGELLRSGATIEREYAEVVAERTGTDASRDQYPLLVAAVVGAVIRVASEQWLRADPPVPLPALLRDSLDRLAAGLPAPE